MIFLIKTKNLVHRIKISHIILNSCQQILLALYVGHCRGAIFSDVLSNLLQFNGNKVVKEYYINDYGNQIVNFVKSVFLRIREIKYKEKFIDEKDLYPGDYIKEIAKKF